MWLCPPLASRCNPVEYNIDIISGTSGVQPAALVAGRLAVTSQGNRVNGISLGNQPVHERQFLAIDLQVDGRTATVKRAAEGRVETIEVTLPAVIPAQRDLADEKYPKLKEILKANKKTVDTFDFDWPAPAYEVTALSPPPDPVAGKIVGEGPDAVPKLLELLQTEAKVLSF